MVRRFALRCSRAIQHRCPNIIDIHTLRLRSCSLWEASFPGLPRAFAAVPRMGGRQGDRRPEQRHGTAKAAKNKQASRGVVLPAATGNHDA
eukprot:2273493-Pyramimonas_sp.AAC.1